MAHPRQNTGEDQTVSGIILPFMGLVGGFYEPSGVAVDGSGEVFVAVSGNNAVKEMVAVNGSVPASPSIPSFWKA
jgi:hypothetical protein